MQTKPIAAMWWISLARCIKIAAMHKRVGARTWPEDEEIQRRLFGC